MGISRLDRIIRRVALSRFFSKGWGNAECILRILKMHKWVSCRDNCIELVPTNYPVTITHKRTEEDCRVIEGKFITPLASYMPDIVSKEVSVAYFQLLLPLRWESDEYKPICIHLAGTGDHFYWLRRNVMAKPLLKHGIGALILENPYYGLRKPLDQFRSNLHYVSDVFVMGGCICLECLVLLNWCEQMGFGPLGISGLSMGGFMASLAATNWPKPLVLVPCLSWSTASAVFTEGVMSDAIHWDLLQQQYCSDRIFFNTLSKKCRIVDYLKYDSDYMSDFSFPLMRNEHVNVTNKRPLTLHEILLILESDSRYSELTAAKRRQLYSLFSSKCRISKMKKRAREAVWFMRSVMDEFTHLRNYSVPCDTSLITTVCAKHDAYVPREGYTSLEDLWPGCTVRFIETGHVGAYLWYRHVFRESIVEAFEKARTKCSPPQSSELL